MSVSLNSQMATVNSIVTKDDPTNECCTVRRIFAIADIHVDHTDNFRSVKAWSRTEYINDALIVAGDVADSLELLKDVLGFFTEIFHKVFFVPGNHDLWLKGNERSSNSLLKFHRVLKLCESLGVKTSPTKYQTGGVNGNGYVWLVPLFSWYTTPDEDSDDSLYFHPPYITEDLPKTNLLWMDNYNCVWPDMFDTYPAAYFCDMNDDVLASCPVDSSAPIVSFSHFVPRMELLVPDDREVTAMNSLKAELAKQDPRHDPLHDPRHAPKQGFFNFSRFAGCKRLDEQIRRLGSTVHVYGHEHRNHDRWIDGVRYIAHSLGYKRERDCGIVLGLDDNLGPRQIWPMPPSLVDNH